MLWILLRGSVSCVSLRAEILIALHSKINKLQLARALVCILSISYLFFKHHAN